MRLFFILYFSLICVVSSRAQMDVFFDDGSKNIAVNAGGRQELKRLFNQEIIYPEKSLQEKFGGQVILKFMVKANGEVSDLKLAKSVNDEIDKEAIRIFKMLEWIPTAYWDLAPNTFLSLTFDFNPAKYKKVCKKRGYDKIVYPAGHAPDSSYSIITTVDQPPVYPEGNYVLESFLLKNIEYPSMAQMQNIQGTVLLNYIVEPNGMVSNVQVVKSVGAGCDEEAIRVLSLIRWHPAIKDDKWVRTRMKMPFEFNLSNQFKDNSQGEQK